MRMQLQVFPSNSQLISFTWSMCSELPLGALLLSHHPPAQMHPTTSTVSLHLCWTNSSSSPLSRINVWFWFFNTQRACNKIKQFLFWLQTCSVVWEFSLSQFIAILHWGCQTHRHEQVTVSVSDKEAPNLHHSVGQWLTDTSHQVDIKKKSCTSKNKQDYLSSFYL